MKHLKSSWLAQRASGCLPWVAVFSLAACKTGRLAPATPVAEELRPSWSSEAYAHQRTDQAWHFAYAVQSWAAEPTLVDEYSVKTSHRGVVIGASFSAHPAIGMVGHGAGFDPQNKSHIVVFFGKPKKAAGKQQFPGAEGDNRLMTNIDLFSFPEYLQGRTPNPYVQELTVGTGIWLDHKIDDTSIVHYSPAGVRFERDNMLMMMDREPIDKTDVTALIYMNFKGADLSAHRWGLESIETRDNLREEDACIGRLVEKLNQRVGRAITC